MAASDYSITFLVDQPPKETFDAVNNVRGWWSETVEGGTHNLNDEFVYEHKPYHRSKQKLVEVIPNEKVVWLVTESDLSFTKDKTEWAGTKVSFEISQENGKTKLNITHHGLVPEIECFNDCSKGWNYYLQQSLLPLITTGAGKPDKKEK